MLITKIKSSNQLKSGFGVSPQKPRREGALDLRPKNHILRNNIYEIKY
jgi:hypothetical protein